MRHGCLYLQTSFEEPVALALCIDNQLSEREAEKEPRVGDPRSTSVFRAGVIRTAQPSTLLPGEPVEPMQIRQLRLPLEEREMHFRAQECLYCVRPGNFIAACPPAKKPWLAVVSGVLVGSSG